MTTQITKGRPLTLSTSGAPVALPVHQLRTDGGTQPRASLDPDHLGRLREALAAGETLPPLTVFYDGADHWLADGFHRLTVLRERGALSPLCDVRQGTRRDAVLYSTGANRGHGLPRSREDLRRAIETLLRDDEWRQWSDREIARQVGCTHDTVGSTRRRLESTGEIASSTTRKSADGKTRPATVTRPAEPALEDEPLTPHEERIAAAHAATLDRPLDEAELSDLSRLAGWEFDSARTSPQGLTLVRMRDDRSGDRLATEERSPDGWRHELAQLRATEAARDARRASGAPDATWQVLAERAAAAGCELRFDGDLATLSRLGMDLTSSRDKLAIGSAISRASRLARPVAEAPAPASEELRPPAQAEYTEWVDRAHAVGCGLSRDGTGFELIEPDGARSRYPYWLGAIGRVRHFETAPREATAPPPRYANPDALTGPALAQEQAYAAFEQELAALLAEDSMSEALAWALAECLDLGDDVDDPREALWEELTERAQRRAARLAKRAQGAA